VAGGCQEGAGSGQGAIACPRGLHGSSQHIPGHVSSIPWPARGSGQCKPAPGLLPPSDTGTRVAPGTCRQRSMASPRDRALQTRPGAPSAERHGDTSGSQAAARGPRQSAGVTSGTEEGTYVLCIVWKSCCPSRETPALIAYAWLIFSSFSVRALLASWRGDQERGSSAEHRPSGRESSEGTGPARRRSSAARCPPRQLNRGDEHPISTLPPHLPLHNPEPTA